MRHFENQRKAECRQWPISAAQAGKVKSESGGAGAGNVVRQGIVSDPTSTDPNMIGVRRMNDLIAARARVAATVIQTVGSKAYDGFALIRVN